MQRHAADDWWTRCWVASKTWCIAAASCCSKKVEFINSHWSKGLESLHWLGWILANTLSRAKTFLRLRDYWHDITPIYSSDNQVHFVLQAKLLLRTLITLIDSLTIQLRCESGSMLLSRSFIRAKVTKKCLKLLPVLDCTLKFYLIAFAVCSGGLFRILRRVWAERHSWDRGSWHFHW